MGLVLRFDQGFLDERFGVLGFLGDDSVFAQDVIPVRFMLDWIARGGDLG